jgi:hypothetical protein
MVSTTRFGVVQYLRFGDIPHCVGAGAETKADPAPVSAVTMTGLNVVGAGMRSQSSCRQRNNWLT